MKNSLRYGFMNGAYSTTFIVLSILHFMKYGFNFITFLFLIIALIFLSMQIKLEMESEK